MAAFKVGQRVRIVAVDDDHVDPPLIGKQGCIASELEDSWDYFTDRYAGEKYVVEIDDHPSGEDWDYTFFPWQLEPVQYDGNKVVGWEECLWQPEHIRQTA